MSLQLDQRTLDTVDEVFAAFQQSGKAPGIVFGIVAGGEVIHAGSAGSATPEGAPLQPGSVLRIASMTKSFTAAAALLLRDEGLLRLDEPIGTYVPELAGLRLPTADSPMPTIRMLLTMSGGLPSDDPWADREESMTPAALSELLAGGLSFIAAPGVGFEYSNLGYVIVGRAIANVAGESYHDFVRTRLLAPLGMTSTGFSLADVPAADVVPGHHRSGDEWLEEPFADAGEFSPLGGIFSSVGDLAIWVDGFTAAFPPRDGEDAHPLRRASRREMQQLQRFTDVTVPGESTLGTPPVRARATGYGFGLSIVHDTRWGHVAGHSGGYPGYGSHMRWHTASGIGIVALANGRYAPAREPALTALEVVLDAVNAPSARITRWSRTRELQRAIEGLVRSWDDAVADRIFAANVDGDQPRSERRAEIEAVAEQLGAISAEADPSPDSDAAADVAWWLMGENGRARLELMLTPHAEPLVQSLDISFVGDVRADVAKAAAGAIDGGVVQCVGWRSDTDATFRVDRGVDRWNLVVTVDLDTGEVHQTLTPTPPSSTRFDVSEDSPSADRESAFGDGLGLLGGGLAPAGAHDADGV